MSKPTFIFPALLAICLLTIFSTSSITAQLVVDSPGEIQIECSAGYDPPYVTATSSCGGIDIEYVEEAIPGECTGMMDYILTVTVTDACSNAEIVNVFVHIVDNTSPAFTSVPGDISISCDDPLPPIAPAEASDNCSSVSIEVSEDYINDGPCSSYVIRTYTAVDECANYSTYTQTISLVDTEAPIASGAPEIATTTPGIFIEVSDNCNDASAVIVGSETIATSDPDMPSSNVTYAVSDACGNTSYFEQIWQGCGLISFHALNYAEESLAGFGYTITDNSGAVVAEEISTGGPTFDANQCLPGGCYHLHIINPNPLDPNIEWHLDGAYGGTFYGFISLEYDFSIGAPCEIYGCTNPESCNYEPYAEQGATGVCFSSCSMMTFVGDSPLGNIIFGAELIQINSNYYQSFILPDTTVLELLPFTEYTLTMSSTGPNGWDGASLLFQNAGWNWSYQATLGPNGPFVVNFTTGGPGCMDQVACNYNSFATISDQSCVYPQTYYLDTDNDGYAQISVESCFPPSASFVIGPLPLGDCNDFEQSIHPNAPEICGNNIDEDCDQLVDENCAPPAVPNDDIQGAPLASYSGSAYPQGICWTGTLVGVSNSGPGNPDNVLPGGGQDVWFSFIASSSALRVVCTTSAVDIVLELQTEFGVEIDMENDVADYTSGEIMVYDGLTPGDLYYVAVRSYDGVVGPFNVCIQTLAFSTCADGSGTYDLCANFKPTYSGANSYTFQFTPTGITPGVPTSATAASQIALSNPALALRHGGTYDVLITGNFIFTDAAGNDESVSITADTYCAVTIAPHADLRTKAGQRCPATILKGTTLQAKPFICGALYHTITFTEIGDCAGTIIGGIPFSTTTSGTSPSKSLASVGGVQSGKWYKVQWTPHFAYGTGTPGTIDIIHIGGNTEEVMSFEENNESELAIYPNPNNGQAIQINLTGINDESITVRITDMHGKLIWIKQLQADGSLNTSIVFERPLESGLYLIETWCNDRIITQKLMVTH